MAEAGKSKSKDHKSRRRLAETNGSELSHKRNKNSSQESLNLNGSIKSDKKEEKKGTVIKQSVSFEEKVGSLHMGIPKPFPLMTKFERARILATRCAQLNHRMPVSLTEEDMKGLHKTSRNLAREELSLRTTPMIIERHLPNGSSQKIPVQDIA